MSKSTAERNREAALFLTMKKKKTKENDKRCIEIEVLIVPWLHGLALNWNSETRARRPAAMCGAIITPDAHHAK